MLKKLIAASLAASALLGIGIASSQESSYYFRYTNGVLNLMPRAPGGGEEKPGNPDPAGPFTLVGTLPSTIRVGESHTVTLSASGPGEGGFKFSATGTPEFMHVAENGAVLLDPLEEDVGDHEGIHITVSSGDLSQSFGPYSITVTAADVEQKFPYPVSARLNGTEVHPQAVFDGKTGIGSQYQFTGPGELVLTFSKPFSADAAYLYSTGNRSNVTVEALVSGNWTVAGMRSTPAASSLAFSGGVSLTSDTWRLRHTGSGNVAVQEFRPGPAPSHSPPVFVTKSGPTAIKGQAPFQFKATSPSTYYSNAPVAFSFPDGQQVPDGVTLTADGLLSVAMDSAMPDLWDFQVVATDGIGFKTTGAFQALADVPDASTVMATSFTDPGGNELDYRIFYDGAWSATSPGVDLQRGEQLIIEFPLPVKFTKYYVSAHYAVPRVEFTLERQEGEGWVPVHSHTHNNSNNTGDLTVASMQVGSKFRLTSQASLKIVELRIGNGPAHSSPYMSTNQHIHLQPAEQTLAISAVAASTYGAPPATFGLASGSLPAGSRLDQDGTLHLSSLADSSEPPYAFVARATDRMGFQTDKTFYVWGERTSASTVMADVYSSSGQPLDRTVLYDGQTGDTSAHIPVAAGDHVILDFRTPVQVASDAVKYIQSSTNANYTVSVWASGEWWPMHTRTGNGLDTTRTFPYVYGAQYFKLEAAADIRLHELRIGSGSAHTAPQITSNSFVGSLQEQPSQIQLTATSVTAYTKAPVAYQLVSGELPDGATLSSGGLLSLPAATGNDQNPWRFTVRVTDGIGLSSEKELWVYPPTVPASEWLATDFRIDGSPVDHKLFYDGLEFTTVNAPSHAMQRGSELVADFGRLVKASSLKWAAGRDTTSLTYLDLYAEIGGEWVHLKKTSTIYTNTSETETFPETAFSRIKIVADNPLSIRELRVGAGTAYTGPSITDRGFIAQVDASPSQYAIKTAATAYRNAKLSLTLADGSLPSGATLAQSGILNLPALSSAGQGPWPMLVRVDDGLGYASEKWLAVSVPAPSANDILPVRAFADGQPVDWKLLYDTAATSTSPKISFSQNLVIEFDRNVSFSTVQKYLYKAKSGTDYLTFDARVGGHWVTMTPPLAITSGYDSLAAYMFQNAAISADALRMNTTAPLEAAELRAGNGSRHQGPKITSSGFVAMLQPQASSVQIQASVATYVTPLTYKVVGGQLPPTATLSGNGLLSLPASEAVPHETWRFVLRVTDGYEFSTEAELFIGNPSGTVDMTSAAILLNGSPIGPQPSLSDKITTYNTGPQLQAGQALVVDFGEAKSFTRIDYHANATGSPARTRLTLSYETAAGAWVIVKDETNGNSGAVSGSFGLASRTLATRRVKIEAIEPLSVNELRVYQ